ncbi:MAG: RHS repeat-associated core domain-containing protein [Lysobacter sp.]
MRVSKLVIGAILALLFFSVSGPAAARFVSVDPVQANPNTGANFNRYYYANNNPYKFTDPDGREVVIPWGTIGEVAGKRLTQAGIASQVDSPVPGPGDVVGAIILVGAVGEIGYKIYQANTPTNDEKVDGLIKTGTKEGESSTTKISRPGGEEARNKEYSDLGLNDVKDKGNGVKVGETDSGRRVVSRPSTEDGRPTIEIQRPDGKSTEKIRYDDKK